MGSTNMKGFVMSMQRRGKVHHAILVEQVRGTSSETSLDEDALIVLLTQAVPLSSFSISVQIFMAGRRCSSSPKCSQAVLFNLGRSKHHRH